MKSRAGARCFRVLGDGNLRPVTKDAAGWIRFQGAGLGFDAARLSEDDHGEGKGQWERFPAVALQRLQPFRDAWTTHRTHRSYSCWSWG